VHKRKHRKGCGSIYNEIVINWRIEEMGKTIEIRLSQEELDILRKSIDSETENITRELEQNMDSSSPSEIIEAAGQLRAAQAAKFKLDVKVAKA
jgi:hypothetical protein